MTVVLAAVPEVDNRLFVAERERLERERLDAARCPECEALPPNHLAGCGRQKLPDPAAKRHWCGYVAGSLGCRLTHGDMRGYRKHLADGEEPCADSREYTNAYHRERARLKRESAR